ncbi:MAG: DUF4981 domain-containing protein [Clostridia bacterium]|nr:DUF4981 domain-containing protein [Clostridia bacterium]
MIIENFFEDLDTIRVNTCPDRAYYLPASDASSALARRPGQYTDRTLLLNGDWAFSYRGNVRELSESFWEEDFDLSGFSSIDVPSVWQMRGYDINQYESNKTVFPFDPPYVGKNDPCGLYARDFTLDASQISGRVFVDFEGVDSCLYLWINGKFVGYDQVSHSTSEFELTSFVREGVNRIAVLVLKWCDGTYLETQDKFRSSGIFRDVFLVFRPKEHLWDFTLRALPANSYRDGRLEVSLSFSGDPLPVSWELYDGSKRVDGGITDSKISCTVPGAHLWNAEDPYLYKLLLRCSGEYICAPFGFREVKIENKVALFNGKPFKIRGVNRHDSSPYDGPAVDLEHVKHDLFLMKSANVNAIRTSHYPNAPFFTELCDLMGFYVVAEGDLECHCVISAFDQIVDGKPTFDFGLIASDPAFKESWLDRDRRLYERDKNRASVFMWSVGNESGYGENAQACVDYLRQTDPTRLVHYEGRSRLKNKPRDIPGTDVHSVMYPKVDYWKEYFAGEDPLTGYMCEYAHSMGNAPGSLKEYWDYIYSEPRMLGGCVWEWCEHAVYAGTLPDGRKKFLYGGDSGEKPHSGCYCLDGLVTPDRRDIGALTELKNAYRPAKVEKTSVPGEFRITNLLDFTELSSFADVSYEITDGKKSVASGKIALETIPPHGSACAKIELPEFSDHAFITFFFARKNSDHVLDAGHVLGFEQIELSGRVIKPIPAPKSGSVSYTEDGVRITVCGDRFKYVFNTLDVSFESMYYLNSPLIAAPSGINIMRAPISNDRRAVEKWKFFGCDSAQPRGYGAEVKRDGRKVRITCAFSVGAAGLRPVVKGTLRLTIDAAGRVFFGFDAKKYPSLPFLPRFGVRFFIPKSYEKFSYLGYGPSQSYADKLCAARFGYFESGAKESYVDYIRPQEHGSHFGTERLSVDGEVPFEVIAGKTPFSFSLLGHTQELLMSAAHNYELEEAPFNVLCVDYKQQGIGNRSCGPDPMKPYLFSENRFRFDFVLAPYGGEDK